MPSIVHYTGCAPSSWGTSALSHSITADCSRGGSGTTPYWSITPSPDNALVVENVLAYRYTQNLPESGEPLVGVALVVELTNPDSQPWSVVGASLMHEGEEVKKPGVWPPEALAPKQRGSLVVETGLTQREAGESFTLQLWDESGARSITVGNVRFP